MKKYLIVLVGVIILNFSLYAQTQDLGAIATSSGGSSSSGGSGTVTSVAAGCGLSGGTITATGTISQTVVTAAHNGAYAILTGDCGKSLTTNTAAAWTIAQAGTTGFAAGWFVDINNVGSGSLTVTATTSTFYGGPSANISGSVLTVPANTSATIISDGVNYQVLSGGGGGGLGAVTATFNTGAGTCIPSGGTGTNSCVATTGSVVITHNLNSSTVFPVFFNGNVVTAVTPTATSVNIFTFTFSGDVTGTAAVSTGGSGPAGTNGATGATGATGAPGSGNNALCVDATGSTTTYTCPTPSPTVSTLTGLLISFIPQTTNSGSSTVNVAALGVKTLKQSDCSTNLSASALTGGSTYLFAYNGTVFCQGSSSGSGGGTTVTISGSALAGTTGNLNSTTPALPLNNAEAPVIAFHKDSGSPTTNITGYITTTMQRPSTRHWAYVAGTVSGGFGDTWTNANASLSAPSGSVGAFNVSRVILNTTSTINTPAHLYTSASNWDRGGTASANLYAQSDIQLGSAVTTERFWWVFTDQTPTTMIASDTPAGNWAGFRYSTSASDTNFMCANANAGTTTITSSGIAADLAKHTLEVFINDANSHIYFFIDGSQVCDSSTNLPAVAINMRHAISLQDLAAATRTVDVDHVYIEAKP